MTITQYKTVFYRGDGAFTTMSGWCGGILGNGTPAQATRVCSDYDGQTAYNELIFTAEITLVPAVLAHVKR